MFRCSVLSDSATQATGPCKIPLSMGFPRQEYWSGLPFPSPGDHLDPGIGQRLSGLPYRGIFLFSKEKKILQMLFLKNHLRFISLSVAVWRHRRVTRVSYWHSGPRAFCLDFGDAATAKDRHREGPQDGRAGKAACGVLAARLARSPLQHKRAPPPHPGSKFQCWWSPSGPKR